MSNEELAVRVQNGDADAILLLWNAVERFVVIMAEKYAFSHQNAAETDDLINSGYIAVHKAALVFDAEKGTTFLTLLGYYLKSAFAEASGIRITKKDALLCCDSLNVPAFQSDSDSGERLDYIEDDNAEISFYEVEQRDFVKYARSVIYEALNTVKPVQQALLIDKYLNSKSWKKCAAAYGFDTSRAAIESAERAAYKLRHGRYTKQLRECLDGFTEYNAYKQAAYSNGLGTFNRFGVSSIEATAILKDGGFENE